MFAPTARRVVMLLEAVTRKAMSFSLKLPSTSFNSFVRSNSPELIDSTVNPNPGRMRLSGVAKLSPFIDVSSKSRAVSRWSTF